MLSMGTLCRTPSARYSNLRNFYTSLIKEIRMIIGHWLCGSYPLDNNTSPTAHINAMLELAPNIVALGGGEHRKEEENWVVPVARDTHERLTGFTLSKNSGLQYWHYPLRTLRGLILAPRVALRLRSGTQPVLPYVAWANEDHATITAITNNKKGKAAALTMRGVPSAKALQFFSGITGHLKMFEKLLAEQISTMKADIIQLELPAELALISLAPSPIKNAVTKRLAASIERTIRQTPKGTRFAMHLCWGDLGHRPFVPKPFQSHINAVKLINAISSLSVWNDGWQLHTIHVPFCDGDNPPSQDKEEYKAYDELLPLPKDTMFALGILHASQDTKATRKTADTLMNILRKRGLTQFALAAPCGFGRTPLKDVQHMCAVAEEVTSLSRQAKP